MDFAAALVAFRPARAGDRPLHREIEAALRRMAASPAFWRGALLPDEVGMAAAWGVSRGTVRSALGRLAHEGVIERRPGVGTRVARRPVESAASAWRSLTREMQGKGIRVVTFEREFRSVRADAPASAALGVRPGSAVHQLDRVRGWNGRRVLFSRSWFHPRLRLNAELDYSAPLYEVIQRHSGVVAERAREEFLAVAAGADLARLLSVPSGEPLLLRRHRVADASGRPVEYAEVYYVSTRFTLSLDLQRALA